MLPEISRKTNVGNSIKAYSRQLIVGELQKQIANAFNLYLNYKHYHWQTFSPLNRDLNIIFDEFANEVYATVEQLAESVRMIDQNRVRIGEFRENATIKPAKRGNDIREMIREADRNVLKVISEFREIIKQVPERDQALSNLISKILKMHEKHEWWLHYILDKRQGLKTSAQ